MEKENKYKGLEIEKDTILEDDHDFRFRLGIVFSAVFALYFLIEFFAFDRKANTTQIKGIVENVEIDSIRNEDEYSFKDWDYFVAISLNKMHGNYIVEEGTEYFDKVSNLVFIGDSIKMLTEKQNSLKYTYVIKELVINNSLIFTFSDYKKEKILNNGFYLLFGLLSLGLTFFFIIRELKRKKLEQERIEKIINS